MSDFDDINYSGYSDPEDDFGDEVDTCEICDGVGILHDHLCKSCQGTGLVWKSR
jgi:DnaJ-class molecular chaperone